MKSAAVYRNGEFAGKLIQRDPRNYCFIYDDEYFLDSSKPAVSLTLPKTQKTHESGYLFPFFFNLLPEGVNRQLQARLLKIDENDFFSMLLALAHTDTIGPVTVKPVNSDHE